MAVNVENDTPPTEPAVDALPVEIIDNDVAQIEADPEHIVIRMYNVGFGDCFLIQIPTDDGFKRVLIDCGVHNSGRNRRTTMDEVIDQVIEDVSVGEAAPYIDVVIATHRHQDHVSGFGSARWEEVGVGEVWLPWTENYRDPKAVSILKKQSTTGKKLLAALQLLLDRRGVFGLNEREVEEMEGLKGFSENSLTNAAAMQTLHYGFKGGKNIKRLYLPYEKRSENTLNSKLLPGITVHVMGPSRDPEVVRDMDPATGEHWFSLVEDQLDPKGERRLPFHKGWSKEPVDADYANYVDITKIDQLNEFKSILGQVRRIWTGTEFSLAVSLDKAVNGTSLMLMFQIGNAYLLFPGDAQNGTWQSALKDDEWRDLLTKTNFYKVGHHGSHNATPKEFVLDVLQTEFRAMIPVYPVKKWEYIPKKELVAELRNKNPDVIRSDKAFDGIPDPPSFKRTHLYVETRMAFK